MDSEKEDFAWTKRKDFSILGKREGMDKAILALERIVRENRKSIDIMQRTKLADEYRASFAIS